MPRFASRRLAAGICACAALGPPAFADTSSAVATYAHLDLDAMAGSSGAAGARTESSVLGQWGASVDTAAAGWWQGGRFELSIEGLRSGGNASAGTGAVQTPSNEWATNFLRVEQATYRHDFGGADLRVGVMDVSQYFESSAQADLLHNSSFGMMPTMAANFDGPTYPNAGLGAMGELHPGSGWVARAGIWQGKPPGLSGALTHGATSIAEVERDWSGADAAAPGSAIRLGAWHDQPRDATAGVRGSGAYLVGETGWRSGARQWGAFVQGGTAPAEGELVTSFVALGVLLDTPFAGRPNDQASLGISRVRLSSGGPETVIEAVYSIQVTAALAIQPDLQRVIRPGGIDPSAWIGGARVRLRF